MSKAKVRLCDVWHKNTELSSFFHLLHDVGFFQEKFPFNPTGRFSQHFDGNSDLAIRMFVTALINFSESATSDQFANFDKVSLDPVLVLTEHVLLFDSKK